MRTATATPRRSGDRARLLASLALLTLVWHIVDAGALLERLTALTPGWLLGAAALSVPMHLLSAWRWRFTSARLGLALDGRRAVSEYYLASLLNAVLPAGVAGDALRVWRHARSQPAAARGCCDEPTGAGPRPGGAATAAPTPGRGSALHAVLLERAAGQFALGVLLLGGVALSATQTDAAALHDLTPLAIGLMALALLSGAAATLGISAATGVGHGGARRAWQRLYTDLRRAWLPLPVLLAQLGVSLLVVGCYLVSFWMAARASGVLLSPTTTLVVVPIVLYAMAVPVSVGGFGLRELSAAALFVLIGFSATDGVVVGLAYWLVTVLGALPGALVPLRASLAPAGH